MARATAPAALVVLVALAGCGGGHHPPASKPTPAPPPSAAPNLPHGLAATDDALRAAVAAWHHRDRAGVPATVTRLARRQQAILRQLAAHPRSATRTIARLPGRDRRLARDVVAAQAALRVLNAPQRTHRARQRIRLGPAEPAGVLLRHYREAQRRSGVPWTLLAAVNFVESDFGRLRNDSIAGAQGPMQFIRSTWASYGGGGDVHDPRDAILGAARFLRAAGAPGDVRAALRAYNPSDLYVTAVTRYRRVIAHGGFLELYAWAPPVPR